VTLPTPNTPPTPEPGESQDSYRLRYHRWLNLLDDGDFWAWVLLRQAPGTPEPDDGEGYDPYQGEPGPTPGTTPCEVCGTSEGSCGYDGEGRPYIHTTPADTDDDGDPVPTWYYDSRGLGHYLTLQAGGLPL
jgi:hypothetical protein